MLFVFMGFVMKKVLIFLLIGLFIASVVNACPKGQHPYGGIGPHHKGEYCT